MAPLRRAVGVSRSMGIEREPPPPTVAQPLKRKEHAPTTEQIFGDGLSPEHQAAFDDLYDLWSKRKRIRVLPRDGWLEISVAMRIRDERKAARRIRTAARRRDKRKAALPMAGDPDPQTIEQARWAADAAVIETS